MNRKKIILTASAIILAAASVFAGIKKSSPSALYVKTANGSSCVLITNGGANIVSNFTTTTGTDQAVILTTGGAHSLSLWATGRCSSAPVYFNN